MLCNDLVSQKIGYRDTDYIRIKRRVECERCNSGIHGRIFVKAPVARSGFENGEASVFQVNSQNEWPIA